MNDFVAHLKKTHDYYSQVQLQMFATGIHRCDFVVWTPHGTYIENIDYDLDFINDILPLLKSYYDKVFVPTFYQQLNSDYKCKCEK